MPAHVEARGRSGGTRQRAVTTAISTPGFQTFEVFAAASSTTNTFVAAGGGAAAYLRARLCRVLLWLQILIIQRVYVTAPAAPRALAALRSGVFAHSQPASSSSSSSSDGAPSARSARTRPHAHPFLLSLRSVPATHSSPTGAGRCRRRRRATLREQASSPAGSCRHRRVRRR